MPDSKSKRSISGAYQSWVRFFVYVYGTVLNSILTIGAHAIPTQTVPLAHCHRG